MNDLSLWDGLIGALVGAVIALVPSYLMLRAARAANRTATAALEQAKQANEISGRAVEEARSARKIQYADWHRQAEPEVVLEKGKRHKGTHGYELKFSCNRDIEAGSIMLVPGYDPKAVTGLGASPGEEVFNFGEAVSLPAMAAGMTAVKGIWVDNARTQIISLRCEVTIGNDTWPIIRTVRFPSPPRVF
ncbi:hypothetical protein [Kribbella sp. NPDC048928]|uniref:hypothetical protein n=1 Tax=Kribbella sp. NPDC048928 TaxID=3364111 RepID=UPI0037188265